MPINILMPALSPTMTEGKIARWLKKEGEAIRSGDVIAEIETDKATMEVEAADEGTLGKILVPAGQEGVKVNTAIALLLEEGEDASALSAAIKQGSPDKQETSRAPQSAVVAQAVKPAAQRQVSDAGTPAHTRIFVSPLARRLAAERGIDLSTIAGSGPHGRILRADIEQAKSGASQKLGMQTPAIPGKPAFGEPDFDLVPHTTIRKTIARRLVESKQLVPHFYLSIDCEIDALLKLREELNNLSPAEGPGAYKLSVNDLIIKAAALALKRVPAANASWSDEGVKRYKTADISVAVAVPNGLVTPIIRQAEAKRLPDISAEMKGLAKRAREGKLKPEDYTGGSFSLSNLGMYGIKSFSAIINPPQGCILAVGAGQKQAVVRGDAIVVASVMNCTLSVDHRVVDGAIGAEFLAAFKHLIETPIEIALL